MVSCSSEKGELAPYVMVRHLLEEDGVVLLMRLLYESMSVMSMSMPVQEFHFAGA